MPIVPEICSIIPRARGRAAWWGLILVVLAITRPLMAQEPLRLDLESAIVRAFDRNRELVVASYAVDSRSLAVENARSKFDIAVVPQIVTEIGDQGQSSYGVELSKRLAWGTTLRVGAQKRDGSPAIQTDDQRSRIQVELEQPIFRNFGRLVNREQVVQASNNLKSARRRLEMQKADLIIELVDAFEEIIRLGRQIDSDIESRDRLDALYHVTRAKEALGRTTRIDTLRVDLLRGEATNRLSVDQERFSSIKRDFAELLGLAPDTEVDLVPTARIEFTEPNTQKAVSIALRNRLDYAQVQQDHEDTTRQVQIAHRKLLPDLTLVARSTRFENGTGTPLEDEINFVGLSVGTDLNLKKARIAVGQAELDRASALETIELTELSIAREVQQQLRAYTSAYGEVRIAERNLDLASSRAKLAHRLFDTGRADNFSVTDAEESLAEAENRVFSARARATLNSYKVPYVLGTLLEVDPDLKPEGPSS